ncbi:MAG: protein translocase subunit SecD [Actinomycetota bacterium]|nr:protein translocase subunit SecD [Actinomycetota bacterium]
MNRRPLWTSVVLILAIAWGSAAAMFAAGWEPKLGLDLQGGFAVVLAAPEGTDPAVLDQAVETMRSRIENLGAVQEPEISVQGDRRILVQLPGVEDRERALAAVGTTGQLSFRPVLDAQVISPAFLDGTLPLPESLTATTTTSAADGETTATTTTTTVPPAIPDNIDPETGLSLVDDPFAIVYLRDDGGLFYALGPAFLTGADMTGAEAGFAGVSLGQGGGGWTVDPSFTSEGGDKFEEATAFLSTFPPGDPRRQMAIVLDGVVISAPQIAADVAAGEALPADNVVITLGSTEDAQAEAEDLATVLQYGSLPTTFERESEGSVSASLGSDSLRAGLYAGVAGLLVVAIALIAYYRALGVIAVVGLSVFGTMLMSTIILLGRFQGTTLTLAGVTGIIVSIGITADSYIVFFERIKEEHRRGRALRPAVDYGFKRAFHTIVTADTVTFMGSILLWLLAIGPVKGFALTLGIATVVDVIVAYFFTRPTAILLVRTRFGEGGAFSVRGAMGRSAAEGVTT